MARNTFADFDTLDSTEVELTDAELEALDDLSSDLDRWGDDSFDEDRAYITGLLG